MKPVVVIPTYDEAASLPRLLDRLVTTAPEFDVLVVDDSSPDGTGEIADKYAARFPSVRVLHRPGKSGLGSAYRDGFRVAVQAGAPAVFEMDADLSHNPKYLAPMWDRLQGEADVVIGSRYVHGVRVENWPFRRLLLSRLANFYANLATGVPASVVSDMTSGFRGYRREVFQALELDRVRSNGYCFQIEMAYRAWRLGFRVREFPITFEEHYLTSSKISRRIIWEAVWRTPLLRLARLRRRAAAAGLTTETHPADEG